MTHRLLTEAQALLPLLLDQGLDVLVEQDLMAFESEYRTGHRVLVGVNRFIPDEKNIGDEVESMKTQVRFARPFETSEAE
jgi:methylmalonyl-CoA mutase N-terminal domain/subunit